MKGKLIYFILNIPTACPPRTAVPVNTGAWFHEYVSPQHARVAFGKGCDCASYVGGFISEMAHYVKFVNNIANSALVSQIEFKNNGTPKMSTAKQYDKLNRLASISSIPSDVTQLPLAFVSQYNSASQRVRVDLHDGSYWIYDYDSLGQVKSGKKYFADNTPVPGQQFEYAHDDIGNRISTGGRASAESSYNVNSRNQYTSRTVEGGVDVVGAANKPATVTVNGAGTDYRRGEYWHKYVSVDNSVNPVWQNVSVTTTGGGSASGNVFVPKTSEVFDHDLDGNLLYDGRWDYTWDAENRLIRLVARASVGIPQQIEFEYDWRGRRIGKKVWNDTQGTGNPSLTRKFLYDGWNLIAELDGNNTVFRSYVWGTDLSGSLQGAGGVGGLLMLSDPSTINDQPSTHFVAYDLNGNMMGLVKAADGTWSARYEYGPFGEVIRATGPMAKANPFRFSTKYQDDETDLVYYGYRYYNASTGRWTSKDLVGERGGRNLYGFLGNDAIRATDSLGLRQYREQDNLQLYPARLPMAVKYPRNGPFQCCRGRTIGVITLLGVIVDADNTKSLKSEHPGLFDEINQNFPLSEAALSQLSMPSYIGGGPYLRFDQTWDGTICCPRSSWRQTFVGSGGGDGTYYRSHFADIPGTLPKTYPGGAENEYNLQLRCHRGGYTFTVWEMIWSYRAHWQIGKPGYSVTVTLPW